MRGIARRLDDETRKIETGGQPAAGDDVLQQRHNAAVEVGINVHRLCFGVCSALTQFGRLVKKPLMLGKRVAVGHASNIVADDARHFGFVLGAASDCQRRPLRRH